MFREDDGQKIGQPKKGPITKHPTITVLADQELTLSFIFKAFGLRNWILTSTGPCALSRLTAEEACPQPISLKAQQTNVWANLLTDHWRRSLTKARANASGCVRVTKRQVGSNREQMVSGLVKMYEEAKKSAVQASKAGRAVEQPRQHSSYGCATSETRRLKSRKSPPRDSPRYRRCAQYRASPSGENTLARRIRPGAPEGTKLATSGQEI